MSAIPFAAPGRAVRTVSLSAGPALPAVMVFLLAMPLFNRLIETGDHDPHIRMALRIAEGRSVPPHPLFHGLLLVLVGLHGTAAAPGAAALLLALAVGGRTWLTAKALEPEASPTTVTALSLLLGLAMPLPNWWGASLAIGQPSASVWHSPTFLLAAPLSLWLFLEGVRLLDELTTRQAAVVGVAMALSLLAKPNYVLAFAPCFGPAVLIAIGRAWRQGGTRILPAIGIPLVAFGPALVVMGWQALWLRGTHPVFLGYNFAAWHLHSPNIPASILLGVAFPLTVAACYFHRANADRTLTLAWTTLGLAVATFAMMMESGAGDANWGWGKHLATAVLFVVSTTFLLRQPIDWRRWVCLAVLVAHATSGAIYLSNCLATGRF
jgi:hypothetical protein